jgi:hypothetical protein
MTNIYEMMLLIVPLLAIVLYFIYVAKVNALGGLAIISLGIAILVEEELLSTGYIILAILPLAYAYYLFLINRYGEGANE